MTSEVLNEINQLVETMISEGKFDLIPKLIEERKKEIDDMDIESKTEILLIKVDALKRTIDYDEAILTLKSIIKLNNSEKVLGKVFYDLGKIYELASEYDLARDAFTSSIDYYEKIEDNEGIVNASIGFCAINIVQGKLIKAIKGLEKILMVQQEQGFNIQMALITEQIGTAYYYKGDLESALSKYMKSLTYLDVENDASLVGTLNRDIAKIFQTRGDLDTAMKYNFEALQLRNELEETKLIAESKADIASVYSDMGELTLSLATYQESLELFNKEKDYYNIAKIRSSIGYVYYRKGELDLAISQLDESLQLQETLGVKLILGETLTVLGDVYYSKKDYDYAMYYQNRSISIYNEMKDTLNLIQPVFSLFQIGVVVDNEAIIQSMMKILKQIFEEHSSDKRVKTINNLAEVILLKSSGRRKNLGQAELILDEIIEGTMIDAELNIQAMHIKCDLLLDELKTSDYENEIVNELQELIEKLQVIAQIQKSTTIRVETLILQNILWLLQGKIQAASDGFIEAKILCEQKGLQNLQAKVEVKKELFEKDAEKWEKISELDISIKEKLKFGTVANFFELSQSILFDPYTITSKESPVSLMVINSAGLLLFTHKFNNTIDLNEHLISAFLTAISAFSQDAFGGGKVSETFKRINHNNYNILFKEGEILSYYYIYEELGAEVDKKLSAFIKYFDENVGNLYDFKNSNMVHQIDINEQQKQELHKIFF